MVFKSPAKAARPVVYMALSPDYEGSTNEYLHMFNPKKMDPKVYDSAEGKILWDRSMELLSEIDPDHGSYIKDKGSQIRESGSHITEKASNEKLGGS